MPGAAGISSHVSFPTILGTIISLNLQMRKLRLSSLKVWEKANHLEPSDSFPINLAREFLAITVDT